MAHAVHSQHRETLFLSLSHSTPQSRHCTLHTVLHTRHTERARFIFPSCPPVWSDPQHCRHSILPLRHENTKKGESEAVVRPSPACIACINGTRRKNRSVIAARSHFRICIPPISTPLLIHMATLPTSSDGYIDPAAADTLSQRIWDIDEQLSDIDSIDGNSDFSEFSTTSSTSTRDIQREWDENMEQGRQLFAIVIFPFVGRWIGKKVSYWSKSLSFFSFFRSCFVLFFFCFFFFFNVHGSLTRLFFCFFFQTVWTRFLQHHYKFRTIGA